MKVPLEPLPPPTPNDPLDWEPVGIHDNVKTFLVNNTEVEEQGRKGVD